MKGHAGQLPMTQPMLAVVVTVAICPALSAASLYID